MSTLPWRLSTSRTAQAPLQICQTEMVRETQHHLNSKSQIKPPDPVVLTFFCGFAVKLISGRELAKSRCYSRSVVLKHYVNHFENPRYLGLRFWVATCETCCSHRAFHCHLELCLQPAQTSSGVSNRNSLPEAKTARKRSPYPPRLASLPPVLLSYEHLCLSPTSCD